MALIDELRRIKAEVTRQRTAHPWALRLQRVRGSADQDGIERVTTQAVIRPGGKVLFPCPQCGLQRHERDAVHCKACGQVLNIPDDDD